MEMPTKGPGSGSMKNIGPAIVIGMLLVSVLVVIFVMWGPLARHPGMTKVEDLPGTVATPERPARAVRPPEPSASTAESSGRQPAAGDKAAATMEFPNATAPSAAGGGVETAPGPSFPSAADIPAGMEKSVLVRRFGKPDMVTSAVDRGRLIETYVYLRRDPNTATVVMLRGNRVIGSKTTVY